MSVVKKRSARRDRYLGIRPEHRINVAEHKEKFPDRTTYSEAWIHQVMDYYMQVGPVQFPSGEKDAQGRDLPDRTEIDGGANQYKMRPGSVYFTRALMRTAWDAVSGESGWYVPKDGVRAPTNNIIDQHIDKMLELVDLQRYDVNQYMFSPRVFDVQQRMEVWEEHLRRKELYSRRATPTKDNWEIVWSEISHALLVDTAFIRERAEELGIPVHGSAGTDQKIKSWCRTTRAQGGLKEVPPKLEKVAFGLYRVTTWHSRYRLPVVTPVVLQNWRYEFVRRWAYRQHAHDEQYPFRGPTIHNTFGASEVIDTLENYEFRPERFDVGYINHQLATSAVAPANLKDTDTETLFVAHAIGTKDRYRINPAVLDHWFAQTIRFNIPTVRERVLRFIAERGKPGEPFWFTLPDLNQIIRITCGGPLMDFASDLIMHMPLHVYPIREAYSYLKARHPKYKPSRLIYILNGYGAAQGGTPYPADFDFEHYEIPVECAENGEPYDDGVPIRDAVEWADDPDYQDEMEPVFVSYKPPRQIDKEEGPFENFIQNAIYLAANGKDIMGMGVKFASLLYQWGWQNVEEPADKAGREYPVWLAGRHRATSGLAYPGKDQLFDDPDNRDIFIGLLRTGPVKHLRKYEQYFEDGALGVEAPLNFESPERSAWLAGKHLGRKQYLEQYADKRSIFE